MDDDGVNVGKHIPIKIRVEVKADEMTIDLSGVSPQVAGPYNSGATAGRSARQGLPGPRATQGLPELAVKPARRVRPV